MSVYSDMLRALEARDVMAWLRAHDWRLEHAREGHSAVYTKVAPGADAYMEVVLPLDTTFRDYARRMHEVVETLAIDSALPVETLMARLREVSYDVIRLRATGSAVGAGRVSVALGTRLFQNARDLLLAAAYTAHTPSMDHPKKKPDRVMAFLERAKFAAPEAGSFIVTVHAPVPPGLASDLIKDEEPDDAPFERLTTLTLAQAVHAAQQAAQAAVVEGRDAPFIDRAGEGVSANLCRALAGLVEHGDDAALEVALSWAPVRPAPQHAPERVRISHELAPVLHEGARALRAHARRERRPGFELVGHVVALESARPAQGGSVVIEGRVDGPMRKVRVALGADAYTSALRAHTSGRMLRCVGELKRTAKGRRLVAPEQVAVVEPHEA